MAAIHSYSNPSKGTTRRTASSHIPVPVSKVKQEQLRRNLSAPEPSRLLMMRNRYQDQLLREKEAKITKMYQQNQEIALERVSGSGNKRGIVRDFFKERREIEQTDSDHALDRTQHFQQKKRQSKGEHTWRAEEEKERQLHEMRRANSERQLSQKKMDGYSRSKPLAPIGKGQSQSLKDMHRTSNQDGFYNNNGIYNKADFSPQGHQPHPPVGGQASNNLKAKPPKGNKISKANAKIKWQAPSSFSGDEDEDEIPIPAKKSSPLKQRNKTRPQVKPEWAPPEEVTYPDGEGDTAPNPTNQRKQPVKPKQAKPKAKPKPEWKPPVSYSSDDENELNQTSSPNFPQTAQIKRKPNNQQKRPQKATDFQKWQLEQDLERVNRLEKYQQGMESQREPEVDYQYESDMKEQKSRQKQRQKELDDMEEQNRYMRELEEKISKKQSELSKYDNKSDIENSPRRQPKLKSKKSDKQHLPRHDSYSRNQSEFSDGSTPYDDMSSVTPSEPVITKPVKVKPKEKPKPKRRKPEPQPVPTPEYNDEPTTKRSGVDFYLEVAETSEDARADLNLRECPICGRNFNADRLAKHAKVCKKTATKKPRKVFDTRKHRAEGTDLDNYQPSEKERNYKPKKKSNWRESHNQLVQAVQDARKVQNHLAKGGDLRDLPPPRAAVNSDYTQCPHCQRRFDPTVAERHIPKCKETKHRPAPLKKAGRR
ncbi:DNA ligase 1-like [Asterias rubens]|uniref:DNA ligase 1-like n=1 Tax=Asterias rubens TaxID=7604 RepID=UPI00145512B2|nr:DNA ligase 1-like [Asterias rubens]